MGRWVPISLSSEASQGVRGNPIRLRSYDGEVLDYARLHRKPCFHHWRLTHLLSPSSHFSSLGFLRTRDG